MKVGAEQQQAVADAAWALLGVGLDGRGLEDVGHIAPLFVKPVSVGEDGEPFSALGAMGRFGGTTARASRLDSALVTRRRAALAFVHCMRVRAKTSRV